MVLKLSHQIIIAAMLTIAGVALSSFGGRAHTPAVQIGTAL